MVLSNTRTTIKQSVNSKSILQKTKAKLAIMEKENDYSTFFNDLNNEIPKIHTQSGRGNLEIIHHHHIIQLTR